VLWNPRNEVNTVYLDARIPLGSAHIKNSAIPHAIEHLVEFSPTEAFPSREAIRTFATEYGIDSEAKTTRFSTEYTGSCLAEDYKHLLLFFKERLFCSRLSEKTFQKEAVRIKEESNERISDPLRNFLDEFLVRQTVSEPNILGRPIGTTQDIEGLTLDAARSVYHQYYTPTNTLLLISGPADLEAGIRTKIEEIFGAIPAPAKKSQTTNNTFSFRTGERKESFSKKSDGQYYFAFAFPLSSLPATEEFKMRFVIEALYLQDSFLQDARDEFGLYHIEADYEWLPNSALLYIYGSTESFSTLTKLKEFINEKLLNKEVLTEERFIRAKQKQKYTLLTDFEFDTRTLDILGTNYLRTGEISSSEQLLSQIEDLKFLETKAFVATMFGAKSMNSYIKGPKIQ